MSCSGTVFGFGLATGTAPRVSLETGNGDDRLVVAGWSPIKGTGRGFLLDSPYEGVVVKDSAFCGSAIAQDINITSRATLWCTIFNS